MSELVDVILSLHKLGFFFLKSRNETTFCAIKKKKKTETVDIVSSSEQYRRMNEAL